MSATVGTGAIRVSVVDASAFTPTYDHALCAALARAGARVELVTSRFAYGDVPAPDGYGVRHLFYRRARGAPGSRVRRLAKLASHGPDMRALSRLAGAGADVVHFQWLAVPWLDAGLLPDRPLVLTAHDLLPREPRPGQVWVQRRLLRRMDAVIVHSRNGRAQLVDRLGVDPERVHVIHHGAFMPAAPTALPGELHDTGAPVVLMYGLLRPYKGLDTLLAAWRGIEAAQLWIVGRPMMALPPIPEGVQMAARYVAPGEAAAALTRADIVVLPYTRTERFDQSGVLADALGAGKATVVSDIGGFGELARETGAARVVAPDDPAALREALAGLIADAGERSRLAAAARAAAAGPLSWDAAARATLAVYERVRR